jgi:hypothetical protein
MRAHSEPRIRFDLPNSTDLNPLAAPDTYVVVPLLRFLRSDSVRRLALEDCLEIVVNDKVVRFQPAAAAVVERLCSGPPPTVAELAASGESEIPKDRLLEALSHLLKEGVIFLQRPSVIR